MNRLEYKWIIYSETITKQALAPLLNDDINVVLINFQTSFSQLTIIRVSKSYS